MNDKLSLQFFVSGKPVAQGSMVASKSGHIHHQNKGLTAWRDAIAYAANEAMFAGDALEKTEPVAIDLSFFFIKPKKTKYNFPVNGDLDKLTRSVLDALEGIIYNNDASVTNIIASKRYGDIEGVQIKIYQPMFLI